MAVTFAFLVAAPMSLVMQMTLISDSGGSPVAPIHVPSFRYCVSLFSPPAYRSDSAGAGEPTADTINGYATSDFYFSKLNYR